MPEFPSTPLLQRGRRFKFPTEQSGMKAGRVPRTHHVPLTPAADARAHAGLSQSQFAALLGVSVRTLQGWEQGRKQQSGAARTLIDIARRNPEVLRQAA